MMIPSLFSEKLSNYYHKNSSFLIKSQDT